MRFFWFIFTVTAIASSLSAAEPKAPRIVPPQIRTFGPEVVAITLVGQFDADAGINPKSYRVKTPAGILTPEKVGRYAKVNELIPKGWPYKPVMANTVFLMLPKPLKAGEACTVIVDKPVTGKALSLPMRFDPAACAPELIKINQCGYFPKESKIAFLGGWLGDRGAMNLGETPRTFKVLDAKTGKEAFTGQAKIKLANDPDSGESVYELDFSGLKTPGSYVIEVENLGRSYPFPIGENIFSPVMVTLARGLYHQRCGLALKKPYTTFTHPACHRGKAKCVDYFNSMDGEWMKKLPDHVIPGKFVDGWGGWHDAGDYDRLMARHIVTVNELLEAYDANPGAFADKQFNIPESGNRIPDVLDEAIWGLDWFERMYDPADGAFYYRIETPNYGFSAPQDDKQQLYCMSKYPYYSCLAGVPFARAARLIKPFDPKRAERYLKIARAAMAYGQKQIIPRKHDGRIEGAIANIAAEIYCATGDKACHKLFLDSKVRNNWSYAMCKRPDVNAQAQAQAKEAFIQAGEKTLAALAQKAYTAHAGQQRGGDQMLFDAQSLLQAYAVSRNPKFRKAALLCLDHHLGANPLGYAWITGVGSRYPKYVLQHPSEYDGIDEPVPGIPIFGPRALSPQKGSVHGKVFAAQLVPPAENYPFLQSYSEIPAVVPFSEFTTKSQSTGVFVYSFFAPTITKNSLNVKN